MEAFLKTSHTREEQVIDSATGELIETHVYQNKFVANSKSHFYQMYAGALMFLKDSHDVCVKVAAFMFEKYSHGDKFALSADIKQDIANYVDCSARSIDGAIAKLVKQNLMRKVSRSTYVINPDFVFKGDATARVKKLKAYLELEYNDNGE